MTASGTPVHKRKSDDEGISEWLALHKREATWAVVAVAVIVAGIWFYERSQALKAQRAETAYFQARQSVLAGGNQAQAVSNLQKVATRYEGTQAGAQAALTLAQALYDQKKYKEGVDALKGAEGTAPDDFKASIHSLEAAGYEGLKNYVAAAQQYEEAGKVTRFPADKAEYQADAARDYTTAGKTDRAIAIWTELAKDETNPLAAEAKVRLGELTAKPMQA
ncbi:MAG TPA: tetratricopeptide repeat protein [Gemmatimonadaceae bacterium]|jgi:predicted negative regulator of RcsB-dependent stress response